MTNELVAKVYLFPSHFYHFWLHFQYRLMTFSKGHCKQTQFHKKIEWKNPYKAKHDLIHYLFGLFAHAPLFGNLKNNQNILLRLVFLFYRNWKRRSVLFTLLSITFEMVFSRLWRVWNVIQNNFAIVNRDSHNFA